MGHSGEHQKLRHRRHCGGEVELPRPKPAVPSSSCRLLPAQDAGNDGLGCARIFTGGDMLVGRTATRHAAAAPPTSVMNSRRSFDRLIGAQENRCRKLDTGLATTLLLGSVMAKDDH